MLKTPKSLLRFAGITALLAALSAGGLVSLPEPAHAQFADALGLSPFWNWKTLESEHFRVTFPAELEEVAQQSTRYLEEAHQILAPKLYWTPAYKTQILVVDNVDAANGLTTPIGRFGIVLQVTPPDNWFSTRFYDDWLRLLAVHEYTHLLNMDATRGIWEPLRYIFGDVFLPNAAWPSWMLEGLAVYMETRYGTSGRGRSTYYEALLRTAVEAGVLDDSRFMTLDKVNGPNPYFPFGETAYAFGYQLMNQVARGPRKPTYELGLAYKEGTPTHPSEDALGVMSERSSYRFPFFINGNLENITDRDWYENWTLLVEQSRTRLRADIGKIRSQIVSATTPLTLTGGQKFGTSISPDGRWLTYSSDTSDELPRLHLIDLKTGKDHSLEERNLGAMAAFTPDSKAIVYSAVVRRAQYYLWSEIFVHEIEQDRNYPISNHLRGRDPDINHVGSQITFTLTRGQTTGLAIASFGKKDGKYRMGEIQTLYMPERYGAVSTPKFSSDGSRIYFSVHHRGKPQEDLMAYDLRTKKTETLIADGRMNRYPTIRPKTATQDELYFLSDATGVDNVYRYRPGARPALVTNVVTGLQFPAFNPQGQLYAHHLSYHGWDVATVAEESGAGIDTSSVTVSPPPAPEIDSQSHDHATQETYSVGNYSLWPSILPRQWAPILFISDSTTYIGGQILGFDAIERHRYLLGAAYNSLVKKPDYYLLYGNRQLGADLTFSYNQTTSASSVTNGVLSSFERKTSFSAQASYPFRWTYSTLIPILAMKAERSFMHVPGANPSDDDIVSKSRYVPSADVRLIFSDAQETRLAISSEQGRATEIGARRYFNGDNSATKLLIRDTEFLRTDALIEHSVLVPSLVYSWVNHLTPTYLDSNVLVEGRDTGKYIASFPSTSLDQLSLRGYPNQVIATKHAAIGSLDYRFPIARIFRGWGTNPAFLENLFGFGFIESAYLPTANPKYRALPSTGAGLTLQADLFNNVPLTISTQYNRGLRDNAGGKGEAFIEFGLSNPFL